MKYAIEKDTQKLKNVLADSMVYIHSNGLIESKKEFIQSIGSEKIVYQKAEFISRKLFFSSKNKIAFRGVVYVKGLYELNHFEVRLAYTSIYHIKGSKTQLIYWQSTKLKD